MGGRVGVQRADDAQVVGEPGSVREQAADLQAALAVLRERERRLHQVADGPAVGADRRLAAVGLCRGTSSSAGLGSNVSTWLGRAVHEQEDDVLRLRREMRRLGREQIGPEDAAGSVGTPSAALALEKNPSRESRSIRANPANPPPTCQRYSRRVRPHGVRLGMKRELWCGEGIGSRPGAPVSADGRSPESASTRDLGSIRVDKLIHVETARHICTSASCRARSPVSVPSARAASASRFRDSRSRNPSSAARSTWLGDRQTVSR